MTFCEKPARSGTSCLCFKSENTNGNKPAKRLQGNSTFSRHKLTRHASHITWVSADLTHGVSRAAEQDGWGTGGNPPPCARLTRPPAASRSKRPRSRLRNHKARERLPGAASERYNAALRGHALIGQNAGTKPVTAGKSSGEGELYGAGGRCSDRVNGEVVLAIC